MDGVNARTWLCGFGPVCLALGCVIAVDDPRIRAVPPILLGKVDSTLATTDLASCGAAHTASE